LNAVRAFPLCSVAFILQDAETQPLRTDNRDGRNEENAPVQIAQQARKVRPLLLWELASTREQHVKQRPLLFKEIDRQKRIRTKRSLSIVCNFQAECSCAEAQQDI
jgi:hypothetical protein